MQVSFLFTALWLALADAKPCSLTDDHGSATTINPDNTATVPQYSSKIEISSFPVSSQSVRPTSSSPPYKASSSLSSVQSVSPTSTSSLAPASSYASSTAVTTSVPVGSSSVPSSYVVPTTSPLSTSSSPASSSSTSAPSSTSSVGPNTSSLTATSTSPFSSSFTSSVLSTTTGTPSTITPTYPTTVITSVTTSISTTDTSTSTSLSTIISTSTISTSTTEVSTSTTESSTSTTDTSTSSTSTSSVGPIVTNLVQNPGFEDGGGSLPPWNVASGDGDGTTFAGLTQPGSNSANAVRLLAQAGPNFPSGASLFQTIALDAGATYNIAYDFAVSIVQESASNCFLSSSVGNTQLQFVRPVTSQGYTTFSTTFTYDGSGPSLRVDVVCSAQSVLEVEVDNFSLTLAQ
ncbi:hypothetical protein JX265_006261 [Neoarthrinium moseri]|uniref:CBM-cenC domain-containing protein n=1 Tax=Neoarthrinium moseri TaxID=1658444 RepID=A0A9P9WM03_9PEZI|nr:hypothetical protein JX266_012080 [Neoarthrinium moseri]KAI1870091.1 hypothetical protein JX265_006261 [Neoarthrinium moseri]